MNEARLDPKARAVCRTNYLRRLRAVQNAVTAHKVTPMPRTKRFSKRGLPHPSYYTKTHTRARLRDLDEETNWFLGVRPDMCPPKQWRKYRVEARA